MPVPPDSQVFVCDSGKRVSPCPSKSQERERENDLG